MGQRFKVGDIVRRKDDSAWPYSYGALEVIDVRPDPIYRRTYLMFGGHILGAYDSRSFELLRGVNEPTKDALVFAILWADQLDAVKQSTVATELRAEIVNALLEMS